jgi:type II secretory pathway component PulF
VAGGLLIITLAVAWRGRQRWPERLLKFRFYRREISISFFRLLGALLEGGRPLLPSLQAASSACVSRPARARLEEARVAIENGESFAAALAATSIFGAEAAQLVAVAESSGRLGEMLLNIARYQEKERELFLKKFTSLLEPVLTLVVGLIVGLVALAMFQPLLQIVSRLQ